MSVSGRAKSTADFRILGGFRGQGHPERGRGDPLQRRQRHPHLHGRAQDPQVQATSHFRVRFSTIFADFRTRQTSFWTRRTRFGTRTTSTRCQASPTTFPSTCPRSGTSPRTSTTPRPSPGATWRGPTLSHPFRCRLSRTWTQTTTSPRLLNILKSAGRVYKSVNNAENNVENVHRSRLEPDHTNRIKAGQQKVLNQT